MIAMIGLLGGGTIIGLLNGMMVMKNGRHRKQILRESSYLLLGIHQYGGIGMSEDGKQETEKLWK